MMEISVTVLYALLLLNVVDCAPDKTSCTYKSEALSYHVTEKKCEISKGFAKDSYEYHDGQIWACAPVKLTDEEIKNLESK